MYRFNFRWLQWCKVLLEFLRRVRTLFTFRVSFIWNIVDKMKIKANPVPLVLDPLVLDPTSSRFLTKLWNQWSVYMHSRSHGYFLYILISCTMVQCTAMFSALKQNYFDSKPQQTQPCTRLLFHWWQTKRDPLPQASLPPLYKLWLRNSCMRL